MINNLGDSNLFLIRHGQSTYNLENRFTGWKDVELTELGKKEANEAGKILSNYNFSHFLTLWGNIHLVFQNQTNTCIYFL